MVDQHDRVQGAPEPADILIGGKKYPIDTIVNGERPEIHAALVATSVDQQRRIEHFNAQREAARGLRSRRRN